MQSATIAGLALGQLLLVVFAFAMIVWVKKLDGFCRELLRLYKEKK